MVLIILLTDHGMLNNAETSEYVCIVYVICPSRVTTSA